MLHTKTDQIRYLAKEFIRQNGGKAQYLDIYNYVIAHRIGVTKGGLSSYLSGYRNRERVLDVDQEGYWKILKD